MTTPERHILVCDDRGSHRLESAAGTYLLGGFTAPETQSSHIVVTWNNIKRRLCGSDAVELKWRDFFADPTVESNPLHLYPSQLTRRTEAILALHELFSQTAIIPLIARTHKPTASDSVYLTRISSRGNRILDEQPLFTALIGLFANYLHEVRASSGVVWHDRLGSENEHKGRQEEFAALLHYAASPANSVLAPQYRERIEKIEPQLHFFDSATTPVIQVADFVTGPMWAASEGDSVFLQAFPQYYLRHHLLNLAP